MLLWLGCDQCVTQVGKLVSHDKVVSLAPGEGLEGGEKKEEKKRRQRRYGKEERCSRKVGKREKTEDWQRGKM